MSIKRKLGTALAIVSASIFALSVARSVAISLNRSVATIPNQEMNAGGRTCASDRVGSVEPNSIEAARVALIAHRARLEAELREAAADQSATRVWWTRAQRARQPCHGRGAKGIRGA